MFFFSRRSDQINTSVCLLKQDLELSQKRRVFTKRFSCITDGQSFTWHISSAFDFFDSLGFGFCPPQCMRNDWLSSHLEQMTGGLHMVRVESEDVRSWETIWFFWDLKDDAHCFASNGFLKLLQENHQKQFYWLLLVEVSEQGARMWPPDLGPPDVQLTLPGFGSVFEDAEELQMPLTSVGFSQSSLHSGGLSVCCLQKTSLSSLGHDLTSLLSCKTPGSHIEKTVADCDSKSNAQRYSCYSQPSLPRPYMLTSCATSPPFGSPPSSLSSSLSSSSLFLASSLPLSNEPGGNKSSQQQRKIQEEYHSIKEEPSDDFSPCKNEPFQMNQQQPGEVFQVGQPLRGREGQDSTSLPFPRPNGPIGHDQQDLQCHWIDCIAIYSSQEELVRHIEKVHIDQRKGEEFSCFWAGCVRRHKPFNARYKLLIHMRVHSGEKPNKCMVSRIMFI